MSRELYRRARRAEARVDRADDRRRLRLEFLRAALAEGLESVKSMHAGGASGEESVRAHARVVDDVVATLFRLIDGELATTVERAPLVVVALGGYGRGELHPSSDIDLMVVYDAGERPDSTEGHHDAAIRGAEMAPYVTRLTQELLYTLWDLGFQVGHSLRSLADCVAIAGTDFPSRTSMQEARFLVGDKPLFRRFGRVLR